MNIPNEGELTKTEQAIYDLVSGVDYPYATTTDNIASHLGLDKGLTALVLDGLEAMTLIEKWGGQWHPNYVEA